MTPELLQRLDCILPPFDGTCVHNIGDITLSQLRELLGIATSVLSFSDPTILSFHDWHEHDGYVVEPKPHSWDVVKSAIADHRVLFDSRDDEFGVRNAIFPRTFDWLLRYNIDQDDESDYNTATCDFDLSVAKNCTQSGLVEELLKQYPELLVECASQPWFESNFGG